MENRIKNHIKGSPYDALNLCYYKSGNFEEGIQWYRNIMKVRPDDYRLTFGLGNIECYRFNFAEGNRCFKKAVELNPSFKKPYILIAWYYQFFNDPYMEGLSGEWLYKAKQVYNDESNMFVDIMVAKSEPRREARISKFRQLIVKYKDSNVCFCRYIEECY